MEIFGPRFFSNTLHTNHCFQKPVTKKTCFLHQEAMNIFKLTGGGETNLPLLPAVTPENGF